MNYYKDKITKVVYAYSHEQLKQVERASELEAILQEKEPIYIAVNSDCEIALELLNKLKDELEIVVVDETSDDIYHPLISEIEKAEFEYQEKLTILNQAKSEYQPLKDEYDSIEPAIFDIREQIKTLKKMTTKEIEVHTNPPIPKEQLIAEAEQQKQLLLAEANNTIVPLQDAVDLDIATNEEIAKLKAWKTYRVYLNRVDTSTAPDIEWPVKP